MLTLGGVLALVVAAIIVVIVVSSSGGGGRPRSASMVRTTLTVE